MKNLSAEMARYGISNADIQSLLGCSNKTVTNKLTDSTTFSVNEAIKIRDTFFPGLRIEYLFALAEQDMARGDGQRAPDRFPSGAHRLR